MRPWTPRSPCACARSITARRRLASGAMRRRSTSAPIVSVARRVPSDTPTRLPSRQPISRASSGVTATQPGEVSASPRRAARGDEIRPDELEPLPRPPVEGGLRPEERRRGLDAGHPEDVREERLVERARPSEHREVRVAGDGADGARERTERSLVEELDRQDGPDAERDAGDREREEERPRPDLLCGGAE